MPAIATALVRRRKRVRTAVESSYDFHLHEVLALRQPSHLHFTLDFLELRVAGDKFHVPELGQCGGGTIGISHLP